MWLVSTPSVLSSDSIKSPIWSVPSLVTILHSNPSRAAAVSALPQFPPPWICTAFEWSRISSECLFWRWLCLSEHNGVNLRAFAAKNIRAVFWWTPYAKATYSINLSKTGGNGKRGLMTCSKQSITNACNQSRQSLPEPLECTSFGQPRAMLVPPTNDLAQLDHSQSPCPIFSKLDVKILHADWTLLWIWQHLTLAELVWPTSTDLTSEQWTENHMVCWAPLVLFAMW